MKVPAVAPGPGIGRAAGRGVAPPIGAAPVGLSIAAVINLKEFQDCRVFILLSFDIYLAVQVLLDRFAVWEVPQCQRWRLAEA